MDDNAANANLEETIEGRAVVSPIQNCGIDQDHVSYRESGKESEIANVRRSCRDPSVAFLDRSDVRKLLKKILSNDEDTVILKLKHHLHADINSLVMDEIIAALHKNKVCQALYAQNFSKAMTDTQIMSIVELCTKKKIWCLNLGENYNVSTRCWESFCKALPTTHITHLYMSEHTISIDLKNLMRDHIRANRKKHDLHSSMKNIAVIEKCTHMWWNPINSIKHQLEASARALEKVVQEQEEAAASRKAKRRKLEPHELTPYHTQYWAEGCGGKGAEKPWKFSCFCGEVCSSYENYRYHPVGRMFECTRCSMWSHVNCVLGNISDTAIEELEDVLCAKCHTEVRRKRLAELRELKLEYRNGEVVSKQIPTQQAKPADTSTMESSGDADLPVAEATVDNGVDLLETEMSMIGEGNTE